jgi:hypothetical protein
VTAAGDQPLAGLVNNPGIAVMGPVKLAPIDAWRKQLEVNGSGLDAARKPRARYLVGRDTWFWLLLNWLPDRGRDWLILSKIHE